MVTPLPAIKKARVFRHATAGHPLILLKRSSQTLKKPSALFQAIKERESLAPSLPITVRIAYDGRVMFLPVSSKYGKQLDGCRYVDNYPPRQIAELLSAGVQDFTLTSPLPEEAKFDTLATIASRGAVRKDYRSSFTVLLSLSISSDETERLLSKSSKKILKEFPADYY